LATIDRAWTGPASSSARAFITMPLAHHPGLTRKGLSLDQQVEVALAAPVCPAWPWWRSLSSTNSSLVGEKAVVSLAANGMSATAPMCGSLLVNP
jgi:hypothetical protein